MTDAARDHDGPVVAVATSGGRDSIALLHATVRAVRALGGRVVALHVHHGLMAEADDWAARVRDQCAAWAAEGWPVEFAMARLDGSPAVGDSVEAWARRERYAALARLARAAGATLVLLAHHRRDQAETVLLQALRGAGPAGLAAMPRIVERDGITWARPWLARSSEDIDAYVAEHGLAVVVDPSNADPRFARSRLRRDVMPALRASFPGAEASLATVARHAAEARSVLVEVARDDLARLGAGEALPIAAWRGLSVARRANALRAWLAARLDGDVPDALVQRLMGELHEGATRRWPVDGGRVLRAWRGELRLVDAPVATSTPSGTADLSLLRCDAYAVAGWAGRLRVFATAQRGVAPHRLAHVLVRARAGGERFQLARGGLARSLKKQCQAAGVPAEARDGPLLFDRAGALLFAPGLGVDARAWADDGAPQWGLRWIPAGAKAQAV